MQIKSTNTKSFIQTFNQNLKAQNKENSKMFSNLSGKLENAKSSYFAALASGDQAKIAQTQDKYQSYTLAMRAAMEFMSNQFQMMMSIVNKLRLNS